MFRSGLACLWLFLALLANPAAAGPWPRAVGEGFLSFGRTTGNGVQSYLEYGLRDRLVVELGLERGADGRRLDAALRWHPPDPGLGLVSGVSLGLRLRPEDPVRQRLTLGLTLGRGFETGAGNLWARAGLQLLAPRHPLIRRPELDLTAQIGLRTGPWLGMLGVSHYRNRFGSETRIRPALGREMHPRLTLVGEAVLDRSGRREGLNLSLWSRF